MAAILSPLRPVWPSQPRRDSGCTTGRPEPSGSPPSASRCSGGRISVVDEPKQPVARARTSGLSPASNAVTRPPSSTTGDPRAAQPSLRRHAQVPLQASPPRRASGARSQSRRGSSSWPALGGPAAWRGSGPAPRQEQKGSGGLDDGEVPVHVTRWGRPAPRRGSLRLPVSRHELRLTDPSTTLRR